MSSKKKTAAAAETEGKTETAADAAEQNPGSLGDTGSQESALPKENDAPKPEAKAKAIKLVQMTRVEPEHAGGPMTADVHPSEVENWTAAGWRVAE